MLNSFSNDNILTDEPRHNNNNKNHKPLPKVNFTIGSLQLVTLIDTGTEVSISEEMFSFQPAEFGKLETTDLDSNANPTKSKTSLPTIDTQTKLSNFFLPLFKMLLPAKLLDSLSSDKTKKIISVTGKMNYNNHVFDVKLSMNFNDQESQNKVFDPGK